jgi:transposase-like protein
MAKAKAKAKRYTDAEKKEILDFITSQGRGGQSKAVKKYGVTAATIAAWKKKAGGGISSLKGSGAGSKELKALEELAGIIREIDQAEALLAKLNKKYSKAKAKLK